MQTALLQKDANPRPLPQVEPRCRLDILAAIWHRLRQAMLRKDPHVTHVPVILLEHDIQQHVWGMLS